MKFYHAELKVDETTARDLLSRTRNVLRCNALGIRLATLTKCVNFCNFFGGLVLGCIKTKICKKYAIDSIFQALQDVHTFAPLRSQNFSKKSV